MRGVPCSLCLGVALVLMACNSDSGDGDRGRVGEGGSAAGVGGAGGVAGTGAIGGGAGGAAGALAGPQPVTPPPVDLPLRPDVLELGTELGSKGWRDSKDTFCSPWVGGEQAALWSTPGALYVNVKMWCNALEERYCSGKYGVHYQSTFVNQGSGWQALRHDIDNPAFVPVGVQGTSLMSIGTCAAGKTSLDGAFTCLGNRTLPWGAMDAAVREDRVFHLATTAAPAPLVTQYTHGEWAELARLTAGVKADVLLDLGEQLLVAGRDGFVAKVDVDTGETKPFAAPEGDYVEGDVLPGGNFVLLDRLDGPGDESAVVIYRDGNWSRVPLPVGQLRVSPSGNIYALGEHELFRIDPSGAVESVLRLDDTEARFTDLAVNSDNEIFLVLFDFDLEAYQCGGIVLAWFDGSELRLM